MNDERSDETDPASHYPRDDGEDYLVEALDHLRGGLQRGGETYRDTIAFGQKSCLQEWAEDLDLLLNLPDFSGRLACGERRRNAFVRNRHSRSYKA